MVEQAPEPPREGCKVGLDPQNKDNSREDWMLVKWKGGGGGGGLTLQLIISLELDSGGWGIKKGIPPDAAKFFVAPKVG